MNKDFKPQAILAIPEHWQARFYRVVKMRYLITFLFVVLSFIAWNRGLALLYGMVAMLLATLAISALLPRLYLARLQIRVLPITPVHAGDEQTINLKVNARKPIYGITLKLPTGEVPEERFAAPSTLTFTVIPKRSHERSKTQITHARGSVVIDCVEARCAYPFGIFEGRKTLTTPATPRTVYPKLITIRSLPARWLTGANQNDAHPKQHQHGDDLFVGLRDYRYGDQHRRIDWRASARAGDIKVREFEQLEQPSFLLVINADEAMNIGEGERNALEHSLSLAASLATFALRQGYHTVLAGACTGSVASSQQLTDFYQQLAELRSHNGSHSPSYKQQVADALAEYSRASVAVSFSLESFSSTPSQQQNHWQCVFNRDSYLKPLMRVRAQAVISEAQRCIIPIRANDDLEQLFNAD